jgi:hypothetical protein
MVAPLRPSITPWIWELCAAATPQVSTTAATVTATAKAIFAILLLFIIFLSLTTGMSGASDLSQPPGLS